MQLKVQRILNINCSDAFGNTALHLAAANGKKQVVIVLLQAGIDATMHNARSIITLILIYLFYLFICCIFGVLGLFLLISCSILTS